MQQGTVHEPPGLETDIWLHVGEAVRSALTGDPKRGKKGSGPRPVTTTSLAGRERLGVGVKMDCVEGTRAWQAGLGLRCLAECTASEKAVK